MSGLKFVKSRVRVDDFIPQAINLVRTVDFLLEPSDDLVTVKFHTGNSWHEWCFDKIYKYVKAAEKRGAEYQYFQLAFEAGAGVEEYSNLVAVARDGVRCLWYPTTLLVCLNGEQPLYKEELVKSWEKMQEHES